MHIQRILFAAGMLAALIPAAGEAQIPATPRELGMGGAYLAVSRGHDALFLNPANLGLIDAPVWSIGFPQVAVGGTLVGPSFGDLPALLDFKDFEEARQSELLNLIPSDGTGGGFAVRAPLVTLSVGGVGVGVAYSAMGSHSLSRSLAELVLKGYQDGRTDYSVGDTFGERLAFWDVAAGYGRTFGSLSLGATAHLIRGSVISRTRLFEPRIDVEARSIEVDYFGVSASGGSGYSLDVGAAFAASPQVTVSAAVSNLLRGMTWSQDLTVRSLTLDREIIDHASPMDIRNRYTYSYRPLDPSAVPLAVYSTAEGLYDEAYMPTVARLGAAWRPTEKTHLAADVHSKLTSGRMGDAWDRRIAVGAQQALWIFKLRGGAALANDGGSLLSGGFSLGALDLGAGRYTHSEASEVRRSGWVATFGLTVHQPKF
jgi:hypothetical protein